MSFIQSISFLSVNQNISYIQSIVFLFHFCFNLWKIIQNRIMFKEFFDSLKLKNIIKLAHKTKKKRFLKVYINS